MPCILGVDEAGRGPVLGPLVYGIAYCPVSYSEELKSIGFADSKALTADRRDTLLSSLISNSSNLGWAVRVMSPQDISAGMLRRRPINLNAQSSAATVGLIAGVLASGVDVTEIYVDTVGDPKSYARLLSSQFPKHIKWTVTSKADAIYPIVGAASIAAKVTRDKCVEGWRYAEAQPEARGGGGKGEEVKVLGDATNHTPSTQQEEGGRKRKAEAQPEAEADDVWNHLGALGSGYPGDPYTVAFLKRTLDPVFGWPGIVRFSWATAKTMLEEKVKVPSSSAAAPAATSAQGGKRSTRSLSRTSSFTDSTEQADSPAAQSRATSLYGTLLPQPVVSGGTATRGYKVKWIDEPVSIAKFFGPTAGKKPASKPSNGAVQDGATEQGESGFEVSALQAAINDWLKNESQWRAKREAAAGSDSVQVSVSKLIQDLALHPADGSFCFV